MSDTLVQDLVETICRRSPLFADNLGLPLTGPELEAIYETVGQYYLREKATCLFMPSVADLLHPYKQDIVPSQTSFW